jgi:hypothetical protein
MQATERQRRLQAFDLKRSLHLSGAALGPNGSADKQAWRGARKSTKCFAPDCICQSSFPTPEDSASGLGFGDRDDDGIVEFHHDLKVLVVSALGRCAGTLVEVVKPTYPGF